MAEKVFLNDGLVDVGEACVSASDSGFLYGMGLFETMRSYEGVVFRLGDHVERLFCSAAALGINNSYDKKFITEAVYQTLKANKLRDGRLRLTLTSGAMGESEEQRRSSLVITATKIQPYPPEYYKKGVLVVLCPFRQNTTEPTCGHKTTNYLSRMMALEDARRKRATEALWFTVDNRLAEGCISNVFLVKDSTLYTPALNTPVLGGIARKTVCELAEVNSIKLAEKDLTIDDLLGAEEVFLTNVIMKVLPIITIEKHSVGAGKVGPMVRRMSGLFDRYIEQQCRW